MSQGNQPINIDVICEARGEERTKLLAHFLKDDGFVDDEEAELLALHDQGTNQLEKALACIWTGMAWFRCLDPRKGNRRTRDLTAQYAARYGESIAAD